MPYAVLATTLWETAESLERFQGRSQEAAKGRMSGPLEMPDGCGSEGQDHCDSQIAELSAWFLSISLEDGAGEGQVQLQSYNRECLSIMYVLAVSIITFLRSPLREALETGP